MANSRRSSSDRRRRVLYTAHHAELTPQTAASRRAALRLREARRPAAAYGARVHRRLRARWYSLVPVRRRTMLVAVGSLASLAILLCFLHYAAVAWPAIAYRPEIARPLRLDRADSFGRWLICALLAFSAGASLLIYQLRRYRIDDFQGHYRLWRLVLIVMMLASLNSLVSLIDWSGALLDAALGKRVALAGSDWIRLIVSIGGIILALRLLAEIRRSRWALAMMVIACGWLAIPEAAQWKFIDIDSVGTWALVTSAPLLAFTTLFLSLSIYLRMLYREVREIEDSGSLIEKLGQVRLRFWRRDRENAKSTGQQDWEQEEEEEEADYEEEEIVEEVSSDESAERPAKPKRRWWPRLRRADRRGKTQSDDQPSVPQSDSSDEDDKPIKPARKRTRRRFSLRLNPADRIGTEPSSDADANSPDTDDDSHTDRDGKSEQAKAKRGGIGRWFGSRGKKAAATSPGEGDAADNDQSASRADDRRAKQSNATSADDSRHDDDSDVDPDTIDWSAMSKSERRRLRKQLRRQGRAA